MKIEILLNTETKGFPELQRELVTEITALQSKDIRVSFETVPSPPGTLAVEEVFKLIVEFIGEHHEQIRDTAIAVKTIIEIVRAVSQGAESSWKRKSRLQ